MFRPTKKFAIAAGLATLLLTGATGPVMGAGFSIFEQGSKAMGMAGAFTAQADDGSAMFHNIAGIGFVEDTLIQGGVTVIAVDGTQFTGFDPFPGSGTTANMNDLTFFPLHGYYVKRVNEKLTFGAGLNSPFGLATQWLDNDNFAGRFVSLRAELITVDLNLGLGWKVNDNFSLGLGAIVRNSRIELLRRVPTINPFTQTAVDTASVLLESDLEQGFGWNIGALHRVNDRFSWGVTYRSDMDIDYGGDANFTQISTGDPVLDAIVASRIPFGQDVPVATGISFPDQAIFGVAVGLTDSLLVEVDYGWTGWSNFDVLNLDFPDNPEFSSVIPQEYEDAYFLRVGLAIDMARGQLRFGYVFDESPQPDASVGPLLPDSDRNGFTVGYGWKHFDAALMYLGSDDRSTTTNRENFNGNYETEAWLLGLTYRLK